MQKQNKQLIIIGSGASIREEGWDSPIETIPIWSLLKDKFTITLNWSNLWIVPTISLFIDYKYYMQEKKHLDTLPLVIGREDSFYQDKNRYLKEYDKLSDNLYLLRPSSVIERDARGIRTHYNGRDSFTKGFSTNLSGVFGLNLAVALDATEIFLLGYDGCDTNGYTHFYQPEGIGKLVYQGRETTGVGKNSLGKYNTSLYNTDINYWFEPFAQELERIKIYNVSLNSKINIFPKISYQEFFKKLHDNINQEEVRKEIIEKIIKV